MEKVSRRKVLKVLLSGTVTLASAHFLSGCQSQATQEAPAPSAPSIEPPLPTQAAAANSVPAKAGYPAAANTGVAAAAVAQATYPDMVVARRGEPEALVRAAVDALGGMKRFVPQGAWVIIKPNICAAYHTYEYAATTNPWVVGALVKLCLEAGAKQVQVMDSPFGGTAAEAYKISGISEQVEAAGGKMVEMIPLKFKETTIENALSLKEAYIYEDALKADVLIDVPIAKNHGMAALTMGMKNLMGLILQRELIHRDFGQRLPDLTRKFKPDLTLVDAVRILTANGPTGGNLDDVRKLDTVIASPDIVAADSYGTTLFDKQPNDLEYVRIAAENGLGRSDLAKLNIKELTLGG